MVACHDDAANAGIPEGLLVLFTVSDDTVTLEYIGHADPEDGN